MGCGIGIPIAPASIFDMVAVHQNQIELNALSIH